MSGPNFDTEHPRLAEYGFSSSEETTTPRPQPKPYPFNKEPVPGPWSVRSSKREGVREDSHPRSVPTTIFSTINKWLEERRERKRSERERAETERKAVAKAAWEASPEGRAVAARAKRLQEAEELKAKLLNPPPTKMAAAIKIWERDDDEVHASTMATNDNDINTGAKRFVVDLYVVPNEEERQIITSFKLEELVLDHEPRYTPEELNRFERAQYETNASISRIDRRKGVDTDEILDQWAKEAIQKARSARHYTKLGDFFNFPHTRAFATNHEAHTYAVRLREALLTKVRGFIEDYRNRTTEETFTV